MRTMLPIIALAALAGALLPACRQPGPAVPATVEIQWPDAGPTAETPAPPSQAPDQNAAAEPTVD